MLRSLVEFFGVFEGTSDDLKVHLKMMKLASFGFAVGQNKERRRSLEGS